MNILLLSDVEQVPGLDSAYNSDRSVANQRGPVTVPYCFPNATRDRNCTCQRGQLERVSAL